MLEKDLEHMNDKMNRLQILIVEDDELQLKLLEGLLRQACFGVVSVGDGHSAIERLHAESFNLVISDVNMPGGVSGFNLVRTVRSITRLNDIPFIFVTGRRDKKDVDRAIDSGVDDYLIKPIDPEMLLAKIEALVSKKGKYFSFSERPANSAAKLEVNFEIDGISEQAIQFVSPFHLPLNYKLKIEAQIFQDIGIEPPKLRITSSEVLTNSEKNNRIRANFIGLSDKEMNAIRIWIVLHQPKMLREGVSE